MICGSLFQPRLTTAACFRLIGINLLANALDEMDAVVEVFNFGIQCVLGVVVALCLQLLFQEIALIFECGNFRPSSGVNAAVPGGNRLIRAVNW